MIHSHVCRPTRVSVGDACLPSCFSLSLSLSLSRCHSFSLSFSISRSLSLSLFSPRSPPTKSMERKERRAEQVDHRRGGGGGDSKRFSSMDDVKAGHERFLPLLTFGPVPLMENHSCDSRDFDATYHSLAASEYWSTHGNVLTEGFSCLFVFVSGVGCLDVLINTMQSVFSLKPLFSDCFPTSFSFKPI